MLHAYRSLALPGAALVALGVASARPAAAQFADPAPRTICSAGLREPVALTFGLVRVFVTGDEDRLECRATVLNTSSVVLAQERSSAILVQSADLDGDGLPELIVLGEADGMSGRYNSYVLTQERPARILAVARDQCPFAAVPGPAAGARAIQTCDLQVLAAEDLCRGCAPKPQMFLMLENGVLHDRSDRFRREYDARIARQSRTLRLGDVKQLLKTSARSEPAYLQSPARPIVLGIAADYVYSGREAEARRVLSQKWPAFDRERVLALLTQARETRLAELVVK